MNFGLGLRLLMDQPLNLDLGSNLLTDQSMKRSQLGFLLVPV